MYKSIQEKNKIIEELRAENELLKNIKDKPDEVIREVNNLKQKN